MNRLSAYQKKLVREYYDKIYFRVQLRKDGIYGQKRENDPWMFIDTPEGAKKTFETLRPKKKER